MLGEYFAVGNPGGDLLGDWRLGDPSVAKVGGDVGGYPILSKICGLDTALPRLLVQHFLILLVAKVAWRGNIMISGRGGVRSGCFGLC